MLPSARLVITCPDKPGIVAAVTQFMLEWDANITALDQYSTDPEGGHFFMRIAFVSPKLHTHLSQLKQAFADAVGTPFSMTWHLHLAREKRKVAILVSRAEHALMELLWRWRRGELDGDITMVISNHPDLADAVADFGLPFHHIPITPETKADGEAKILGLLKNQADLIVLARYMQVLSPPFVAQYPNQIINIHHSFLPAFVGAKPYHQAKERGVKLIGATAHYVTAELDGGPIIAQDTQPVDHRQTIPELTSIGRDIERRVLAQAVKCHLEDRVQVFQHKTVVFK